LEAVPGSTLLLGVAGRDAGGSVGRGLESYGIPPDGLIVAEKTRTRREYRARFNEIDVALDT
jgi:predicted O-linked N-acetylglucosamine transferase (SPINDLY family)